MTFWLIVLLLVALCAEVVARAYRLPPANTRVYEVIGFVDESDRDDYGPAEMTPDSDKERD